MSGRPAALQAALCAEGSKGARIEENSGPPLSGISTIDAVPAAGRVPPPTLPGFTIQPPRLSWKAFSWV